MKPDGVATTEPADDVVEPVPQAAEKEEQVQQDSSPSSLQHEKPENEGEQEGANSTLPPSGKEVNGKVSKPKSTTKAPVKTKPGTASTKASNTTGAAARPATTQSRAANGVMKAVSNGASKKPASMIEMKKKNAPVGAAAQVKKVPTAASVAPRTQVKAAERKAVGSAGAVPSTSSGVRKAAATSSTLSKKPVAGGSSTLFKPKSTGTARQNFCQLVFFFYHFAQPIYLFCSTKAYYCTCCQSQCFSCFQSCPYSQDNQVSPTMMVLAEMGI